MELFNNKTAVITGGAEGIGLAIARAVGQQGMNVVLGDIDAAKVAATAAALRAEGINAAALGMDVSKPEDWQALADLALNTFGAVHALVNNAGVGGRPSTVESTSLKDWRWVIDVNLMGVVMGMQTLVPHIKAAGGGWVVNVGSMAGLLGVPYGGAYNATKVAVVALSEGWAQELAKDHIHVAALCPGFVKTRIHMSTRNKTAEYLDEGEAHNPDESSNPMAAVVNGGIDTDLVGARVVEALRAGEQFIITHPNYRPAVQGRHQRLDEAFARAAESPLVQHVAEDPMDAFVPR